MELTTARTIAEGLVELARPACSRIEIAGSIRRSKPNVKDIELVAIVNDYDLLYKNLATAGRFIKPGVPDIIDWAPKADAKYIRMLINDNIKLDLFVAHEENWGPLYMMRTGGAVGADGNAFNGFVPGMFARWKKISGGGKMVGCMPTMPDGLQLVCPEEQDFFELLEMDFVPPGERVDRKVIKKYIRKSAN